MCPDGGVGRARQQPVRLFSTFTVGHTSSVRRAPINILSDRSRRGRRVPAFVPEYGLAPEHPFTAGVDDAQASFEGLVAQGFEKIALAGDSAGGGLALALLSLMVVKARDGSGLRSEAAAVMSPWTDLALSGASMETRPEADPLLTKDSLAATGPTLSWCARPARHAGVASVWRSGWAPACENPRRRRRGPPR